MLGQKEAHELHEKGQLEKKTLKDALSGNDVYQYRRLTAAAKLLMEDKKRKQDEDYRTMQAGRKLSKEADEFYPDVGKLVKHVLKCRQKVVLAQARLNDELAKVPPNIRKIKKASDKLRDHFAWLDDHCFHFYDIM